MQRHERLIRLTRRLMERPMAAVGLSALAEAWGVAKSTLSEDVQLVREVLADDGAGRVETLVGAQGGVRFVPQVARDEAEAFLWDVARRLAAPNRVIAGEFLFASDVLGDPDVIDTAGAMVASRFAHAGVEVVVTVETKGIPLAASAARYLHAPLAIVRREQRVTEGASLTTHYVSGSAKRIQTMSLSTRLVSRGARALIVDDFMRAGATARAVAELIGEFGGEVCGTAVFMATSQPAKKMVADYVALLEVGPVRESGFEVRPNLGALEYRATPVD
ncbi:pur operon repressor [Alicyclobacillus sendaiensis]|uniref:Pur operon repressor n=1 Tax=Alicyclobacillus sendaiensis PA2 TaxID=3029425 RepID=A0ABT6Y0E0_ALISE|nr:pur operon repressor [Alicyclobacillus sendaiensis]MDI9260806.1 pur operon repressor [Alicyclobacillus sendaiensis PA2]